MLMAPRVFTRATKEDDSAALSDRLALAHACVPVPYERLELISGPLNNQVRRPAETFKPLRRWYKPA